VSEHQAALSIVVPVYNEAAAIPELHRQIVAGCVSTSRPFEIIYVDDGSDDGTTERLDELVERDDRVCVIHFRRNFGKSPALSAGFERARGAVVVTLDGDLQDDPALIPRFVARIDAGADLVSGWKKERRDPWGKTLPSAVFNTLMRRLSGIPLHDFNCGFKAYSAPCVHEMSVYGGLHRFLPVLAASRGFRIEEIVVQHRPREHGRSKFGARRFIDAMFDVFTVLLLTRFRTRPLHFFGIPALLLLLAGLSILSYLTVVWFAGSSIGTRPLLTLGVLFTITGFQFFCIGLLGELLVRTTLRNRDIFSIRSLRGAVGRAEEAEP
jgi:glycosyltransferase involved in cell wall biosynthesis